MSSYGSVESSSAHVCTRRRLARRTRQSQGLSGSAADTSGRTMLRIERIKHSSVRPSWTSAHGVPMVNWRPSLSAMRFPSARMRNSRTEKLWQSVDVEELRTRSHSARIAVGRGASLWRAGGTGPTEAEAYRRGWVLHRAVVGNFTPLRSSLSTCVNHHLLRVQIVLQSQSPHPKRQDLWPSCDQFFPAPGDVQPPIRWLTRVSRGNDAASCGRQHGRQEKNE